jgi:predicted ribosome quality control (RQC) complex YloA/Tae2 family protein
MYFDALTLAAVADELRATILNGRIQHVQLPTRLSITLEIYAHGRRQHLLLSAHPQWTRAHLCVAKPSRGVERATPLLLLLRKYVVGGHIVAIEQPALERVLLISIAKGRLARNTGSLAASGAPAPDADSATPDWADDDDAEPLRCELILEAMERRGNIILVGDDNIILDSARYITPRMSHRAVQPREPYELPPAQNKRDPRHTTSAGIQALLEEQPARPAQELPALWRALVGAYRGLAPLAAREAVFRATGQAEQALAPDLPWAQLAEALRELWSAPWQPCLVFAGDQPAAFAPYALNHLAPFEPQPSISAALELFYAAREQLSSHQQRRDAIRQMLFDSRERLERQHRLLSIQLERAQALDRLRWEGEMIYGFLHAIEPGQTTLDIEGRSISLDPAHTPSENAQARFHAYDKAKGALAGVPERLHAVAVRLAGLDETLALLDLAEGFDAIEGIAREAIEQGYIKLPQGARKTPKVRRLTPLRIESSDGYTIYVGRSASQNEQVTFKLGAPDDLWLHARGFPGAHVIVKSGGKDVPEQTLREAAELAAYFSKGREERGLDVEVARRALVRRVPNGPTGLVTYQAERTIRVAPRAP